MMSTQFDQIDMESQRYIVDAEHRKNHEEWVAAHQSKAKFDHHSSIVRAQFLIDEACMLERGHLAHQFAHCKKMLRRQKTEVSSPSKMHCESEDERDCPCIRAPIHRQLLPKYRAMNLLQPQFQGVDLEVTVDTIQATYANDHEMMQDLLYRYGPEEPAVDPRVWLRCLEYRMGRLDEKWTNIGNCMLEEMRDRDNFANVIRNLSIMRIFLEGSQSATYSADFSERARRDAHHQSVLDRLNRRGTLFLNENEDATLSDDEDEEQQYSWNNNNSL